MEGSQRTPASALGSPPPVVPPLRGSRRGGAGVHAGSARPASCLPTRAAGLDKARRFDWLRCACGQRLQPCTANRRIEMQIKLYKRGGAVCGRKKREWGEQGLLPAVQLRALGAPGAWGGVGDGFAPGASTGPCRPGE